MWFPLVFCGVPVTRCSLIHPMVNTFRNLWKFFWKGRDSIWGFPSSKQTVYWNCCCAGWNFRGGKFRHLIWWKSVSLYLVTVHDCTRHHRKESILKHQTHTNIAKPCLCLSASGGSITSSMFMTSAGAPWRGWRRRAPQLALGWGEIERERERQGRREEKSAVFRTTASHSSC